MKSHLGTYLGHYAGILAGAAAVIAGYQPSLITSVLPFLGPHAAAIVGGAAALVALLHAFGVDPPPSGTPSVTLKALLPISVALVLAMLAAAPLIGCTSLFGVVNSPSSQPYVTAAVDIAVATAEQHGVGAAKINAVAKVALAADNGTAATLATVAVAVNAQIARLNLPPGDFAAASILEIALEAAIQAKIGKDPTIAAAQAAVADVLRDVIASTGG